jgi:Fe-S cluster assembly ATP-binding protein
MALTIDNVTIAVDSTLLLHDISLSLLNGTIHVLMGPNGAGKSSLAYALAGHPRYGIVKGSIAINGADITSESPDKRARRGIFLGLQNPIAVPGITIRTLLEESYRAITGHEHLPELFAHDLEMYCSLLGFSPFVLERAVHEGFSGGERKKIELLQLLILNPHIAILDEIDSGVDADGVSLIAQALAYAHKKNPLMSFLIITHHCRITKNFIPHHVHVLCNGEIVRSGDYHLSEHVSQWGYDEFKKRS